MVASAQSDRESLEETARLFGITTRASRTLCRTSRMSCGISLPDICAGNAPITRCSRRRSSTRHTCGCGNNEALTGATIRTSSAWLRG